MVVVVLVSPERRVKPQFIVISPSDLLKRLIEIHGECPKYHVYPWVTKTGLCLEGRDLESAKRARLAEGKFDVLGPRDLSPFLNNWSCLERLSNPQVVSRSPGAGCNRG